MDVFQALPALRSHPLLSNKSIALIGVSTIVRDDAAYYFEISRPKYWRRCEDGTTTVGIGGIGGSIQRDETIQDCLRREAREELGVRVRLEPAHQTYLIDDWQIVDTLELPPSKKRPVPLMVILVPPRLGGPNAPDHLAILAFRTRLRGTPAPRDLFGLLRIESQALPAFFARDEWRLDEAQAHPALATVLNDRLPHAAILRPILTARAFQLLVHAGAV